MMLGLALVFALILWDVRADDKECPPLECAKQGPNCVAVKDPDDACKHCSCNSTESKNSDPNPEAKPEAANDGQSKDEASKSTEDATKPPPKSEDKTQSKPTSESHGSGGDSSHEDGGTEHSSPCADCPEGCMVTMFRGKCTGCVSIEDPSTECR
ncbi:uncharacterized protein LOC144135056 [Amblyomma americanum]